MSAAKSLNTRLTEFFGIEHPILLAPMAFVSGGRLAAAVTAAGGLGLIGGGYGDAEWLRTEIAHADGARVGYGFITWGLARNPDLLDMILAERPATIMLSFGELRPFAERIRAAGVPLIAQVQTVEQARGALDVGVIDGRGLAAALALGADGVLVGTRFWAAPEALVSPRAHQRAVQAEGDDTFRTQVYDAVRQLDWPAEYNERALGNSFLDTWHGSKTQLSAKLPEAIEAFEKAVAADDFDAAAILISEGVGLIHDVRPAADIVHDMVCGASEILHQ